MSEGAKEAAAWLRLKSEYGASLSMSGVREAVERGNVGDVLRELARLAERDAKGVR